MSDFFKVCSTCRKPIEFDAPYFKCSVSTCNRKRTGLFFCSIPCWDAHVPGAGHRDAWAEKETAPSSEEFERSKADPRPDDTANAPRRVVQSSTQRSNSAISELARDAREAKLAQADGSEVLVVVSKLKKYIKERSGMNTSSGVLGVLSDYLRELSDEAIRVAAADERKTVLDRDFEKVIERVRARSAVGQIHRRD